MDALDLIIVAALLAVGYAGWRRTIAEQSIISAGMVVGLFAAAIVYARLAFLTEASNMRSVLLLLLVGAAGFLSYDLTRTIFRRLRYRKHKAAGKHHAQLQWWQRSISTFIGLMTGLTIVWFVANMVSNSTIVVVRQQVNGSRIVASVRTIADSPPLLKQIAHIVQPFGSPQAFAGAEPLFSQSTAFNQQYANLDTATEQAKKSVVKVSSWGCGATTIGSGFLASKTTIITNAHVIAGATRIIVQDQVGSFSVKPIAFDPILDVAILQTEGDLSEAPLPMFTSTAKAGTIGSIIGYPGGGALTTSDAIVIQSLKATGYDIYGQNKATRGIYALRASVVPGNSGGPLINDNGTVIGLVFGNATTQAQTGYAITTDQIVPMLADAQKKNVTVASGTCAGV